MSIHRHPLKGEWKNVVEAQSLGTQDTNEGTAHMITQLVKPNNLIALVLIHINVNEFVDTAYTNAFEKLMLKY